MPSQVRQARLENRNDPVHNNFDHNLRLYHEYVDIDDHRLYIDDLHDDHNGLNDDWLHDGGLNDDRLNDDGFDAHRLDADRDCLNHYKQHADSQSESEYRLDCDPAVARHPPVAPAYGTREHHGVRELAW
jgi:hypothetical protein